MAIPELSRGRELPRPVLQAMVVCDQAIPHADTEKVTLVGIFDRIQGGQFPLHWARPTAVYARVTDAEGDYDIRLELVRLEDERTIGRMAGRVDIEVRIVSRGVVFNLDERKLPRQVDTSKVDLAGASGLGRNVSGGTWPRLSWGRSVL